MARNTLPNRRAHELISFTHDGLEYVAGFGFFESGDLAEVFLDCGKQGCGAEAIARDSAILASIAMQNGVPAQQIQHSLQKLGNGNAASALGKAFNLIQEHAP